jgi:hypothetical protein
MSTVLENIVVMLFLRVKFYALKMDAMQRCTNFANGLGLREQGCLLWSPVLSFARPTIYNAGIILDGTSGVVNSLFLQIFLRD